MRLIIDEHVCVSAHLMSNQHRSFIRTGKQSDAHSHINMVESFFSIHNCAQIGMFHYMSPEHLNWYLSQLELRGEHRIAEKRINKSDEQNVVMKPIRIIDMIIILVMRFLRFCFRHIWSWEIVDVVSFRDIGPFITKLVNLLQLRHLELKLENSGDRLRMAN